MAYSQSLATRIRDILSRRRHLEEKKMFGGVAFLLNGNLLVAVWMDSLIVRAGPVAGPAALKREHVREFDLTGRPMTGWVMVDPDGTDTDASLRDWIELAWTFVATLPPKPPKPR